MDHAQAPIVRETVSVMLPTSLAMGAHPNVGQNTGECETQKRTCAKVIAAAWDAAQRTARSTRRSMGRSIVDSTVCNKRRWLTGSSFGWQTGSLGRHVAFNPSIVVFFCARWGFLFYEQHHRATSPQGRWSDAGDGCTYCRIIAA